MTKKGRVSVTPHPPIVDPIKAELGRRIRALRDAHGMRLLDLAEKAGVRTGRDVWRWEAGRAMPKAESLELAARALGTTSTALLDGLLVVPTGKPVSGPVGAVEAFLAGPDAPRITVAHSAALRALPPRLGDVTLTVAMVRGIWLEMVAIGAEIAAEALSATHSIPPSPGPGQRRRRRV